MDTEQRDAVRNTFSVVPNAPQLLELVKAALVASGPVTIILTNLLGLDAPNAQRIVEGLSALASMAGVVWMVASRSDFNRLASASQVPGVIKIKVDPDTTNPGAIKAAESTDPGLTKVKAQL